MRVYFLGAGSSKALCPDSWPYKGLPLASELTIEHLLDLSNYSSANPELMMAIEVLKNRIAPQHFKKSVEEVIPEIISDATLYQALRICLVSRLWIADVWGTAEMSNWLDDVSSCKDALITTNYDTLLERGIHRRKGVYKPGLARHEMGLVGYGVPANLLAAGYEQVAHNISSEAILLLKLHGSISWSYCENCKKAELDPAYMSRASDALSGSGCTKCGFIASPILVGPARKLYDHLIIENIFATAQTVLKQAHEITFAGFSLNDGDEKIRELLAESHKAANTKSIVIVDPSAQELVPKYQAIYGDVVKAHSERNWKQYLIATFKKPHESPLEGRLCRPAPSVSK